MVPARAPVRDGENSLGKAGPTRAEESVEMPAKKISSSENKMGILKQRSGACARNCYFHF